MSVYDQYEMTIGVECHVQLATRSKLFSPADNDARGAAANTRVHAIDFGLPGMLPVLNRRAVELAVRAGKALGARINLTSRFDRKHYFYPDLPKGYQTTQMYAPIIGPGLVEVPLADGSLHPVRIHHAHLEEDAGKLTHHADHSAVDLNRAGTPLIEIVSEPDIHSAQQARAYANELYLLMTYAGVTHGDLYHGNMRFDVNISVAKKGAGQLGTRTEIKNLNSFRSVERAAEYEFRRQVDVIEAGQAVVQETRGWDDDSQTTSSQRSKEDAQDYRYMPDADIPPVVLTAEQVAAWQAEVPPLPPYYRQAFASLAVDGSVLAAVLARADYAALVSAVQDRAGDVAARRAANWLASDLQVEAVTPKQSVAHPDDIVALCAMVEAGEVSSNGAGQIFNELMAGGRDPRTIAQAKQLLQNSDEGAIAAIVDEVMNDPASAASIADIRAGKDKAIGYLVGQVMKRSKGQANPALAQKLIRRRL